jgi:AraC-like DNA-binding protein
MDYQEFPPADPRLAAIVACIWTLQGNACDLASPLQPILPDGCPELVLHLADPFERVQDNGASTEQPHILFAGQLTSQLVLRPTGRVAVVGVRFHPYGAAAVLCEPQDRLAGLTLGIDDLSIPLARALREIRDAAVSADHARALVEVALLQAVKPETIDPRITQSVHLIRRTRGGVAIDRVADTVSMTRRHLERRFLEVVGMSPKRLARITRFQHALRLLQRVDGAGAAASSGYADQSHFIREFKALAGCSPSRHMLTRSEITGFFTSAGIRFR